jgi:peptidoglycan hydrolase-like protein with peptidoglycan-binding domain
MSEPIDGLKEPGQAHPARRRKPTRAAAISAALVVTLAVAGAATLGLGGRGQNDEPGPRRTGPVATVAITRQTMVDAVTLTGQLGYGAEAPLAASAPGTVTWLPKVGATVRRGGVLLRADEKPIVLFYGAVPMFRPLSEGVEGTDVRQLERNLSAQGYGGFTVDEEFSAATTVAVKRWQEALDLPPTGTVGRHQVVYAPGAVRVARRLVRLGAAATGDVVAYTGGTRVVTVPASPGEANWAVKGARVTVIPPGGASTRGRVTAVAAPAGQATEGQVGVGDGDGEAGEGVEITIAIPDQKALRGTPQGPVQVRYVAEERKNVLTVPVHALLALAEGGYGLEIVVGGTTRVVAVEVGMFAEGRVEVQGDGLAEGVMAGVPE